MPKKMSLTTRKKLLISVHASYSQAPWADKVKIVDGFIAATGYERKYAIKLLNIQIKPVTAKVKRPARVIYDEQIKQALIAIWHAANQICSKRLVPFIPELVESMERHGHLNLPVTVRDHLFTISHSSVDRLLSAERKRIKQSITTTKPGSLFKHRIKVRTFADWDDVIPGFMEADLVAHCGGNTFGSFLNTLVLVDISTGWLECIALIRKSAQDVIDGLDVAAELLPFILLGVDTDNGSEFINHELLNYCEKNNITFTRSRAYKKNDQAHVEEKNGSVVRRLVGYDRFEGQAAWEALTRLYKVMRLYVNFFQPSLKLLSKERSGARVTKKYSKAKTPYQRLMLSKHITLETKNTLTAQYKSLDPVKLMKQLEDLQDQLWLHASYKNKEGPTAIPYSKTKATKMVNNDIVAKEEETRPASRYYHSAKKADLRKAPRTWRTRKDAFEDVWSEVRLRLELNPEYSPAALLDWLIEKYPGKFNKNQVRTLQRRIANWRSQQQSQVEKLREIMVNEQPLESAKMQLETSEFAE